MASVDEAIAQSIPICGHPALKGDLETLWPKASWVFHPTDKGYAGTIENYDQGRCGGIAAGAFDIRSEPGLMESFCSRNMVSTKSVVVEKPLALPACPDIAAGVSYWMIEAQSEGIFYETFEQRAAIPATCNLDIHQDEADELKPLTPANFALPFFVLAVSAAFAIAVEIRSRRQGKRLSMKDKDKVMSSSRSDVADGKQGAFDPDVRVECAPPTYSTSSKGRFTAGNLGPSDADPSESSRFQDVDEDDFHVEFNASPALINSTSLHIGNGWSGSLPTSNVADGSTQAMLDAVLNLQGHQSRLMNI